MSTGYQSCILLGLLLLALRCRADDVALIGVGQTWRYWPAASEPPETWTLPEFDDAEWRTGDSGFGLSRWGENTLFDPFTGATRTVYFRRTFTVADPNDTERLILRCDWQGGFVAYLNGREVARRQMPGPAGSPVRFDTPAGLRLAGAAEDILLTGPHAVLQPGTNVLAIQVHPVAGGSYELVLVPELLSNFTRGPYLQRVLSHEATVLWRTPVPVTGEVSLSLRPDLADATVVRMDDLESQREVRFSQLTPGTRYYYQVAAGSTRSPVYSFRTLPSSGDLDFVVFGDSGAGSAAQFQVARQLDRRRPDLMVHLGDIVYPHFSFGQADTRCLSVYRDLLRTTPSFFAWGNHDLYVGAGPILDAFRWPTNSTPPEQHTAEKTWPESYFSFDAGDAHFVVLFWPYSYQYYMREGCPQLQWLEADLAATTKPWKFLFLHHPVNTSGGHRNDDYNWNGIPDRNEVAARLMPVAARHGVQMIFSGHDHNFERFHPSQGTHLIVSGGGGIILYGLVERDPNSAFFTPRWHFTEVQLRGNRLRLTATDHEGQVFDVLEFQRTPPTSADPDGDGLGPEAERLAGTRPDSPDTDGDGRNDGWEFLRGQHPLQPDRADDGSPLRELLSAPWAFPTPTLSSLPTPDGALELRWLGEVGHRTVLEWAASPETSWLPLPPDAAGGELGRDRQQHRVAPTEASRFYRVRWVPE